MRRLVLLAAVVLLVSCAGSSTDGASGAGAGASADVRVRFTPDPLEVGPVTWTVTITNDTTDDLQLTFPSGKRADITLTRDGEAVYQWSRAMAFTQMVEHLTVPAGGNKAFVLDEPGLDVDPGEYTLTATVATSNRDDLKVSQQVTVQGH
ncbi:MAG: Intracellular proteinase inhibitor [Acidimicrobiales bacterium]|nr:Intracellular proteinase inhibitor [Acidimicrobiales bacterium]